MMHHLHSIVKLLMISLLLWEPTSASSASKPKHAPTEVQKAIGTCVMSLLIGGIGGAIIKGKKGAAVGAGIGGALCAVLVSSAKHRDQIIEAQRQAAAASADTTYNFDDDKGQRVNISSRSQPIADPGVIIPVEYKRADGTKMISADLGDSPKLCRRVASTMSGSQGSAALPSQLFCRTPEGDWEPYATSKA